MNDPKQIKSPSAHMKARAPPASEKDATIPERVMWGLLRDRRLAGAKFRRQHCIGPYIVDFYCQSHRLVVELDGRSHDDRGLADRKRQNYLETMAGLPVLRFGNDDILHDQESVIRGLATALGIEIV